MKTRKIPLRQCVITKERLPKGELVRVVRTPEGEIVVDTVGKVNGRGVYLKKDISVIDKAIKKNALSHHLGVKVPDRVYEELTTIVKEG